MGDFTQQIEKFLQKVDTKLARHPKAAREALGEAGKAMKKALEPNVPVQGKSTPTRRKGTLKRHVKARIKRKDGSLVIYVGIWKKGAQKNKEKNLAKGKHAYLNDPFFWHFVDKGTQKMSARNFLSSKKEHYEQIGFDKMKEVYLSKMTEK
ncbi:HK97-gp10 family putative phage morphogenesis protein [Caviibacterium pharyngocola]|uniref:HK97 gp10 family phage protein n=1 Tax=Caviibacterium pharyngocola TaxID=28159 RepID=A0A2M8RSV9_9PAST|nr:HK97-gp10 family putative phage morphogenesis protein [Caviibacterium pharyngocola]PJG81966.1 hypothetical protein CVP04_11325 [Caviibacterium pharyngocola]